MTNIVLKPIHKSIIKFMGWLDRSSPDWVFNLLWKRIEKIEEKLHNTRWWEQ